MWTNSSKLGLCSGCSLCSPSRISRRRSNSSIRKQLYLYYNNSYKTIRSSVRTASAERLRIQTDRSNHDFCGLSVIDRIRLQPIKSDDGVAMYKNDLRTKDRRRGTNNSRSWLVSIDFAHVKHYINSHNIVLIIIFMRLKYCIFFNCHITVQWPRLSGLF